MSKLCCPVCWELLKLLHGDNHDQLQVYRHHNSLFHIDLLPWLPQLTLQTVVDRFTGYLKMELEQGFNSMASPPGHQYNKSTGSALGDSVSGMTDISDDSTGLGIVPDGYDQE